MATELRQAKNRIAIAGVVKEHKLKDNKGENGKYINGSLVIATKDNVEVELRVFVNQMTNPKDGSEPKEKKAYGTLKSFIEGEYPTMASIKEDDEETKPTIVRVYGNGDFQPSFREERYPNQAKTEMITRLSTDLGFGSIVVANDLKEENFTANYEVEAFVTEITDEVKTVDGEEEETGRLVIKGCVPTYGGGVFPITLIAENQEGEGMENFVEDVRDYIEEGDTVDFWGDIKFITMREKIETKGKGIGKTKVEDKTTYIHDLILNGMEIVEDEEKQYDEDDIRKAIKQRQIDLEEALTKAQEDSEEVKKTKGVAGKRKAPKF